MRYIKKFESYDNADELLEYFIDIDKNHGGDWDVDVSSVFVKEDNRRKPDFYKVIIESRSDFYLNDGFLSGVKNRVGKVLSIGDFYFHNGGRSGVGDPNKGRGNFGFFFLAMTGHLTRNFVVEIDNNTISNIKLIKEKIRSEYYRQKINSNPISDREMENWKIKFGSLVLWFIPKP